MPRWNLALCFLGDLGGLAVSIESSRRNRMLANVVMAMKNCTGMKTAGKPIPAEWLAEFDAAARRPLPLRWRYAFIKTYKPVMDDANYRSFDTMEEYRRWCEQNLPRWLGYRQVADHMPARPVPGASQIGHRRNW